MISSRNWNFGLLLSVFFIIVIGLICIYSASHASRSLWSGPFGRQLIWLALGVGIVLFFQRFPVRYISQSAYVLYGLSVAFLVLVLVAGSGAVHRWIVIFGIRFQPSEFAKFTTVLALSRFLSAGDSRRLSGWRVATALALALFPALLIAKEPDMGTALVFPIIAIVLLFWAGLPGRYFVLALLPVLAFFAGFKFWILVLFLAVFIAAWILFKQPKLLGLFMLLACLTAGLLAPRIWFKLEPYQQQRILIFLGMKSDPHGAAYQVIQSKVAIGSGGIVGKGFLQGTQNQLRFLPEQHTDFIFSVLAEEFGFLGVLLVSGLFLALFYQLLQIAKNGRHPFVAYMAVGALSVLAFQFLVNIGMTVGLAPVTGLPLPFMSYGGSSLLMSLSFVGLVAGLNSRR